MSVRRTILPTEALMAATRKKGNAHSTGEEKLQYWQRKIAIPANKYCNTSEQVLQYWRASAAILASKYCDGAEKYILIDLKFVNRQKLAHKLIT